MRPLSGFPGHSIYFDGVQSQLGLVRLTAGTTAYSETLLDSATSVDSSSDNFVDHSFVETLTDTAVSVDAHTSICAQHESRSDTATTSDSKTEVESGDYVDIIVSSDSTTSSENGTFSHSDSILVVDGRTDVLSTTDPWQIVPSARRWPHNDYKPGMYSVGGIPVGIKRTVYLDNGSGLTTFTPALPALGTGDASAAINTMIINAGNAYLASGATHAARTIQEVVLPAGTFRCTNTIIIGTSGVVLRGQDNTEAGPFRNSTTRLRFDIAGDVGVRIGRNGFYGYSATHGPYRLTADAARLDTTIQVANASVGTNNIRAGDIVCIDEEFDSSYVWMGDGNAAGWYGRRQSGGSDGNGPVIRGVPPGGNQSDDPTYRRFVTHIVEIASVGAPGATDTILTLKEPLPMAFRTAFFAEIWHSTTEYNTGSPGRTAMQGMQWSGLENLYMTGGHIRMLSAAFCWIDKVELDGNRSTANIGTYTNAAGWGNNGLSIYMSYCCEVRRSWVHHSRTIQQNAGAYLMVFANYSSRCLIEDCIANFGNKCITANVSGGGNGVCYNYVDNAATNSNGWQEGCIDLCHNSFTHNFLVEGNRSTNAVSDTTHGNAGMHVFFRNLLTGDNTGNSLYGPWPYTAYTAGDTSFMRAGGCDGYSRESTYIGNVMLAGTPGAGETRRYEISTAGVVGGSHPQWQYPSVFRIGDGTNGGGNQWDNGSAGFTPLPPLSTALSMTYRHYNWDNVNNAVVLDGANVASFPTSLYLDIAPTFFAGYAWPPVNPDGVNTAARFTGLPAYDRFLGIAGNVTETLSDLMITSDSRTDVFVDHSFVEALLDIAVTADSRSDVFQDKSNIEILFDTCTTSDSSVDIEHQTGTFVENRNDTATNTDSFTILAAYLNARLDSAVGVDIVSDIYQALPRPSGDFPASPNGSMVGRMDGITSCVRAVYANAPLIRGPQSENRTVTFTRASAANFEDDDTGVYATTTDVGRYRSLGLLLEEASTNLLLQSRDMTQAAWTKANMTAVRDQVGKDSAPNTGTRLTATFTNATVTQVVTNASSAKTGSIYIKRFSGVGNVDITLNNGTNWTSITPDLVSGNWVRVSISATLANPGFGVRIQTNGDSVVVDFAQIEEKTFATSAITTAGIAVARAPDSYQMATYGFPTYEGAIEFTYTPLWSTRPAPVTVFTGASASNGVNVSVSSTTLVAVIRVATVDTTLTANLTWVAGAAYRIRVAWGGGRISLYRNGVVVASQVSSAVTGWAANLTLPASDGYIKFLQAMP